MIAKRQIRTVLVTSVLSTFLSVPAGHAQQSSEPLPAVRSMVVAPAATTLERQFYGRVVAKETVDLAFDVGGRLDRLLPEEGQRVAAGATLAVLELDGFRRSVERAALNLDMARRDAERALRLSERAVGPESRAEDAITARDLAEIALRDAEAALADATLTAPFDALVAARLAPPQSIVPAGQAIMRLHDMSELRVEIDLPERLFVTYGGLDDLRFMARRPGGGDLPLRLVAFQPDTSRVGQSYRVTLAFVETPSATVLPGASVTVLAQVPATGTGAVVPATAVLAQNDQSTAVMMLDSEGPALTVREVPVTITSETGTSFVVEGLETGAEIVAVGAHRLTAGQAVRRFTDLRMTDD
ncbi:efflux RND transporter periplasmic adaptor subunit [Phaeobacter gallaeciensis]|uniref:efflux RND transporter periplasmic adaptor subunit n=1 Tax=Phaeobacter gallaeciensis TaxID=60890 RepID=UPI00237F8772|nr:efflux RND transporter periplasmic adaptor subunit [Phaeobacter gallaeciensis]MDE4147119.1 efflux RND transporter periplasmic adaptor subunit [Phaeobacter gallaeciensis]MDE4163974.1 efflux RND transporter periplasmic adaptor subunit [Phaeobacter gallaeciensis]MDE4172430.1 efflux RND transporter periplasmic adaptor subunit [Phaeobacter gallaeciensis]MDE4180951.1 efflux RND transporter periplasmic adaptor subunit [Phaeobacter gallaeciensis]MDE4185138.1 efflux RND transporter periplasmic adapt